jgi:hypothetical protein
MPELRGKGYRVLGYFIWMLGAGIVLDGRRMAPGLVLLAAGLLVFAVGVWQSLGAAAGEGSG